MKSGLTAWDLFVLRHNKPSNLALHFVSAVLFFGSPVYGLWALDWRAFVVFCISGCVGTFAHYVTRDGTVSLHEATSSPRVVLFNAKMWGRILVGRYGADVADARAKLREQQGALGRTALVTGCSSGFGEASAEALLARGFKVVGTVRREADGARLAARFAEHGDRLTLLTVDLASPSDRAALIADLRARPRLDAVVCNAGIGVFGAVEDLPEAELRAQMEVSFFAVALLARGLVPMLRASRGVLVNVSSPAGVVGFPWTAAYCASKHAVEGLTESLRHELAPTGVRVHMITPSAHRTQFMHNARWHVPPASPHAPGASAYRAVMEKNQSGSLPPPSIVAGLVADVIERDGYPFRLDVGSNIKVLRAMERWLPEWAWNALVDKVFARAAMAHAARAEARSSGASAT